jgi:hypothetical protein
LSGNRLASVDQEAFMNASGSRFSLDQPVIEGVPNHTMKLFVRIIHIMVITGTRGSTGADIPRKGT